MRLLKAEFRFGALLTVKRERKVLQMKLSNVLFWIESEVLKFFRRQGYRREGD